MSSQFPSPLLSSHPSHHSKKSEFLNHSWIIWQVVNIYTRHKDVGVFGGLGLFIYFTFFEGENERYVRRYAWRKMALVHLGWEGQERGELYDKTGKDAWHELRLDIRGMRRDTLSRLSHHRANFCFHHIFGRRVSFWGIGGGEEQEWRESESKICFVSAFVEHYWRKVYSRFNLIWMRLSSVCEEGSSIKHCLLSLCLLRKYFCCCIVYPHALFNGVGGELLEKLVENKSRI